MTLAQVIESSHKAKQYDSVFTCPRCDGKGHIKEFSHVSNGRCFLCGGSKKISMKNQSRQVIEKKTIVRYEAGNGNIPDMIEVWMNGRFGMECVFCSYINDSNRDEMRRLYAWFRANGAKMQA